MGTVPAYLDGSYGCRPDLREFSTCIFVAGGSGVSYTLPLLLNLIRENAQGGKSSVHRILFIWALRDENYLSWFSKTWSEALPHATGSIAIEFGIYLTAPSANTSSSSASTVSEKCDSTVKTTVHPPVDFHPPLKLIPDRPDIRRALHDEISASADGGSISVDVASTCWTYRFDRGRAPCSQLRCRCTSGCVKRTTSRHSSR